MKLSDEARLILISLADGPKHGYAIAQDIEGFSGRRLGAGTLYGAIARLEAAGQIDAMPGDARRRPYRISAAGRGVLKKSLKDVQRIGATGRRRLAAR